PFSSPPVSKRWSTCAISGRVSAFTVSSQMTRQARADEVDQRARQPAPQLDGALVLRVGGVVLRNRFALEERVLVVQRRRLEAPVLLEVERARAALGAPVVEDANAALASAAHQLPVLEVVCGEIARGRQVARVIGQHFIAE